MIHLKNQTIRSERLEYRLLNEDDKAALQGILSHSEVTAPAGFMPSKTDSEFDAFFKALTQYNTAVAILKNGVLIGYIRVNKYLTDIAEFKDKSCVSTGFVIAKEHHNCGYATEALGCITLYLKQYFDYCFADHFAENTASQRVIEKCGYKYIEAYTMFFEELGAEKACLSYVF